MFPDHDPFKPISVAHGKKYDGPIDSTFTW